MRDLLLAAFVFLFCLQLVAGGILFPYHGWLTCGFGFAFAGWTLFAWFFRKPRTGVTDVFRDQSGQFIIEKETT